MLKRSLVALLLTAAAVGPAGAEGEAPQPAATDGAVVSEPAAEAASAKPTAEISATPGDAAAAKAAPAKPAATPPGEPPKTAAAADDPAPEATAPDPLTPKEADQGPLAAPGAPARAASTAPQQVSDPTIAGIRTRLESWGEGNGTSQRADIDALKAYYADPSAARIWTGASGLTTRGEAALAALARADEWGLDAAAFDMPAPPSSGALPETLIQAEIGIGLAVLKYARDARGGRLDPPSISKIIDMRPRLYEPRTVIEAIASAPAADAYLEGLNPRHAGFHALKTALAQVRAERPTAVRDDRPDKAGQRPHSDAERRIIVNMERWRWLPDDLGSFYVWDNVPEQYTRVVHDEKVVLKEKIVVGKAHTPTPIFSAPMRFVIFHPSWGVPEGIKANELAPMLRRAQSGSSGWFFSDNDGASRALRRHELRVYLGGREVDPDRVNWSSVDVRRFSFTQPPSGRNVLGIVKFRFPNKYDVYMHDTPERHLFSRSPRTFSHGCMRVENPLKLAETILAYDKGWSRDRISQLVARGTSSDITLDKSVPVHIVYFTSTVDDAGKLHTHSDIYGVDSRVASALWGRSVVLSSAGPAPVAKPASAESPRRASPARKSTQRTRPARRPPGGDDFNPFGWLSSN